jgi:hypothetical protein
MSDFIGRGVCAATVMVWLTAVTFALWCVTRRRDRDS